MTAATSFFERVENLHGAPPAIATAFGCRRNFHDNRFVYTVVSARARGLAIGINMNPDRFCNFDCVYCEVNRETPATEQDLDVTVMAEELDKTLFLVRTGKIREHAGYHDLSDDLLQLRHVALSGDGEPTFLEVNPNGQFGWLDDPAGWPLHRAVLDAALDPASTLENEAIREASAPPPAESSVSTGG